MVIRAQNVNDLRSRMLNRYNLIRFVLKFKINGYVSTCICNRSLYSAILEIKSRSLRTVGPDNTTIEWNANKRFIEASVVSGKRVMLIFRSHYISTFVIRSALVLKVMVQGHVHILRICVERCNRETQWRKVFQICLQSPVSQISLIFFKGFSRVRLDNI